MRSKISCFLSLFPMIGACLYFVEGCTTPQQTTTLNTLGTLEVAATAGIDTYWALVIKGTVSTNSVPTVVKSYNDFQAAMVLAVTLVQNNTNALAPASLVQEESALINL